MELTLQELNDCVTLDKLAKYLKSREGFEIFGVGFTRTCFKVHIPELSDEELCLKGANNLTGVYSNLVECKHLRKELSFMPKLFTASDLGLFVVVELGDPIGKGNIQEAEEFFADARRYFKDKLPNDEGLVAFLAKALKYNWDDLAKECPKYDNIAQLITYSMNESNNVKMKDIVDPANFAFFGNGSNRVLKAIDFGRTEHWDDDEYCKLSFSLLA